MPDTHSVDCRICLVIDTNEWRASQLLRDPVSASLLFALTRTGGRVGLPEVIEREVLKHGVALGLEAREGILKGLRAIRALTGQSPAVTLPTDDEFKDATTARIRDLEPLLHRVPFTSDVALRALDRVNAKLPPAHIGQQFKDSAIWESCLDLAADFDVHLVSSDKAFFQNANVPRAVLEERLGRECQALGVRVTLHPSLEGALSSLGENAASSFDPTPVVEALDRSARDLLVETTARHDAVAGERREYRFKAFVTEQRDVLAVTFSLTFDLVTEVTDGSESSIRVEGQAMFNADMGVVSDVRPERIEVRSGGESGPIAQHVYVSGVATLGAPPPIPHSLRVPLPGGGEYSDAEPGA